MGGSYICREYLLLSSFVASGSIEFLLCSVRLKNNLTKLKSNLYFYMANRNSVTKPAEIELSSQVQCRYIE